MAEQHRRELILVRLFEIAKAFDPAIPERRVFRNRTNISGNSGDAIVLIDGSQVVDESKEPRVSRGQVSVPLTCAVMSPQIQIFSNATSGEIGTKLNAYHDRMIFDILNDEPLIAICGPSFGLIRYTGGIFTFEDGEKVEGRVDVNMQINYPVIVSELREL